MKLKKLIAVGLSAVLALSVFTACGKSGNSSTKKQPRLQILTLRKKNMLLVLIRTSRNFLIRLMLSLRKLRKTANWTRSATNTSVTENLQRLSLLFWMKARTSLLQPLTQHLNLSNIQRVTAMQELIWKLQRLLQISQAKSLLSRI